jgi:hypothetical protein
MSEKLRVDFSPPEHGWLAINISHGDDVIISFYRSNCPNDSFSSLVHAITAVSIGRDALVTWELEPAKIEFHFISKGEDVLFRILEYRHHQRIQGTETTRHEQFYNRYELCLTFWRGIRRLQGAVSEENFLKTWDHPFPTKDVELLTKRIEAMKKEGK